MKITRITFVIRLILILTWGLFLLPNTVASPHQLIDRLIEQLADAAQRGDAGRQLQRLGEQALPGLRLAAKNHADPQVRQQAAALASAVERGEILAITGPVGGYWLNRVLFTPDGRHAVATGGAVILLDLRAGREVQRTLELQFARRGLALSKDGKLFVTGHQHDRNVHLGEVATGKVLTTFAGHKAGVQAVALSQDGKKMLTGSDDKSLCLWDVASGKPVRLFTGVTDQVRSVDFSKDGKKAITGHYGPGSKFLVRFWEVDSGQELRSFAGHTGEVTSAWFLPNQKSAISTGMDGKVVLWDLGGGKEVRRWMHPGGVYGAAISPEGRRLLTAGFGDAKVRLWDLKDGRELKVFDGHTGAVLGVAFSGDGTQAISSDARNTVRVWRLPE